MLGQLMKYTPSQDHVRANNRIDHEHNYSSTTVEDLKEILGTSDLTEWNTTNSGYLSGEEGTNVCNGVSKDQEEMNVDKKCNRTLSTMKCAENSSSTTTNMMNGLLEVTPTDQSKCFSECIPLFKAFVNWSSCAHSVPDVSQLDDGMIRLLAEQRIKQLFHERKCKLDSSSHDSHVSINKHLNGIINKQLYSNRKSHSEYCYIEK